MSSHVDSVIILSESTPGTEVWAQVVAEFERHSVAFLVDSFVVFNDFEDREKDPILVFSLDEAVGHLFSWPGLGGIEFCAHEARIPVFLYGKDPYRVDSLMLSTSDRAYTANAELRHFFARLSESLHERLAAIRTVSDYDLITPDTWLDTEIENVRRGIFEGNYRTDLRSK